MRDLLKQPKKLLWIFPILMAGVYFVILARMAGLDRFIADDFCSYNYGATLGWPRYVWFWFITWGGRLSAVSADMLLVILGQRGIGYAVLLLLLIWWITLSAIFHRLLQEDLDRTTKLLVSVSSAFVAIFVITRSFPNFIQTLFWFSAFRTHTLPILLFSIWVWLAMAASKLDKNKIWALFLLFGYAFAISAFSEVFTTLEITALGLIVLYRAFDDPSSWNRMGQKILLAGLIGAVAGFALMFFAPGTTSREATFSIDRSLIGILSVALDGSLAFFRVIFRDPSRSIGIIAGLLFSFAVAPYLKEMTIATKGSRWKISLLALLFPFFVFAAFLPGAYGMGEWIPRRAWSVPIFFAMAPLVLLSVLYGQKMLIRANAKVRLSSLGLSFILLAASFIVAVPSITSDLQRMGSYAENIDAVEGQIATAIKNGERSVFIPQLGNWAGVYDPSDNPKFWVTKCVSEYYSIKVVGPVIK